MTATAFVRARIDEKVRDEAAEVLAEFGLTISDIVRMTLTRVARDQAVPLELKVPNAATRAAMMRATPASAAQQATSADTAAGNSSTATTSCRASMA